MMAAFQSPFGDFLFCKRAGNSNGLEATGAGFSPRLGIFYFVS